MSLYICRNCDKEYSPLKSRADWKGYCSQRCVHEKARKLGYRKGRNTEYDVLHGAKQLGY
jgi:hypothetical protein